MALTLPTVQLTLPVEAVDLPAQRVPVFAPTIVQSSHKRRRARAARQGEGATARLGDGPVGGDELKDPFGAAP
jgi:hypothetical protein